MADPMQTPVLPTSTTKPPTERPALLARSLTLMKPITWFGPMWAFLCGAIASGQSHATWPDLGLVLLGMVLAGPILCGFSQVINDYCDRDIDAINEPHRLIPSGRVSTQQVFVTLIVLIVLGQLMAIFLGQTVTMLATVGMVLAMLYSAPPVRAKRNGWIGNTMVAFSYEGLAWVTGHLVFAPLTATSLLIAVLYSVGSHGIMSINDYKGIDGDRAAGIRTIPVIFGPQRTAWLIVLTMDLAQLAVIGAFLYWGRWVVALVIGLILLAQLPIQRSFVQKPEERYLRFSAIGVSFFVWGMMASAIGLRALQ